MAYSPISQVNITLTPSGVTSDGFGIPIFIADIDISASPDPLGNGSRIKSYTSLLEVAEDFDVTDAAYIAASKFWANSPSVSTIKVGYRDIDAGDVETPEEAILAIEDVDTDWYFVTAEPHTKAEVLGYAAAIESRTKVYFTSTEEQAALTPYDEGVSTDVAAEIKEAGYERTKCLFHHDADTQYYECQYVGYNAPYLAGSVTWTNLNVSGMSAAQNPATGNLLSSSQKGYLEDRNCSYTEKLDANTVIIRNGFSAGGTPIDFIRGKDNLESDINNAYLSLLSRQKGTKLSYTNPSITVLMGTLDSVLYQYTLPTRNFINPNYVLNFLMADDVPLADKEARIYKSGNFSAELQGAIEGTVINGVLSLPL
jgi:hypothetical protein